MLDDNCSADHTGCICLDPMVIEYYTLHKWGQKYHYIKDKKMADRHSALTTFKTLLPGHMRMYELMFDVEFKEVLPPNDD